MNVEKYIGMDNGIGHKESPITVPTTTGGRGEAIYTVNTIYTDIEVDGVKDPAYDYGVHLSGLNPREKEYYTDRDTNLEIYMIRGQNGRLYVYGEVTDPELFFRNEFTIVRADDQDSVNFHIDFTGLGRYMVKAARILTCEDPNIDYARKLPETRVIRTDKGFNFEFSIDRYGKAFENGDTVNFAFYYFDMLEWRSADDFVKTMTKLPSKLDPLAEGGFYTPVHSDPDPKYNDTLLFSDESASGRARIKPTTPMKSGDMLRDIINGSATVSVISGGEHCTIQTLCTAKNICDSLLAANGKAFFINEETLHVDLQTDYRIIVNNSIDGQNKFFGRLGANEYAVAINENTVVLYGMVEKTLTRSTEIFNSYLERIANGGSTADLPTVVTGAVEELPANVPLPSGLDHITDVGDDAYMLMNQNATEEDLSDYERALVEADYKKYTVNVMGGTKTSTYIGHGNVISLSLTTGDNHCLRIVAEPLSKTALPPLTADHAPNKCIPEATLLNPHSLCMIYRLENGEYLILDSGNPGHIKPIYNILSKDGDEHPVVAAWLFSHFHQDHTGSFITLGENDELLSKMTVKSVIYNWPQKLVKDTSVYWLDQDVLNKWESVIDKTGAQRYQARTGQKFFFPGAELEILWTYEDLMPFNLFCDDTNITCVGYRLTVAGQTHLLLGDTSESEMREAIKNLGDYLRSDFVQLAHHGMGSNTSPVEFYQLVDASVVFIPGTKAWKKAEQWAEANAKEVYIRSKGTVTLGLPHRVE